MSSFFYYLYSCRGSVWVLGYYYFCLRRWNWHSLSTTSTIHYPLSTICLHYLHYLSALSHAPHRTVQYSTAQQAQHSTAHTHTPTHTHPTQHEGPLQGRRSWYAPPGSKEASPTANMSALSPLPRRPHRRHNRRHPRLCRRSRSRPHPPAPLARHPTTHDPVPSILRDLYRHLRRHRRRRQVLAWLRNLPLRRATAVQKHDCALARRGRFQPHLVGARSGPWQGIPLSHCHHLVAAQYGYQLGPRVPESILDHVSETRAGTYVCAGADAAGVDCERGTGGCGCEEWERQL